MSEQYRFCCYCMDVQAHLNLYCTHTGMLLRLFSHAVADTRVVQKVLSLIGLLSFIPGIFQNVSLHMNGVLNG